MTQIASQGTRRPVTVRAGVLVVALLLALVAVGCGGGARPAPVRPWVPGAQVERIDPGQGRVVERADHTANALFAGDGGLWSVDLGYSVTRLVGPGASPPG